MVICGNRDLTSDQKQELHSVESSQYLHIIYILALHTWTYVYTMQYIILCVLTYMLHAVA